MSDSSAKRVASNPQDDGDVKKPKSGEVSDHEEQSSTSSSSRSPSPRRATTAAVSHLLQTDTIPPNRPTEAPPPIPSEVEPIYELRTVGVEREGGSSGEPNYFFISSDVPTHPMYNFLDSITEVSHLHNLAFNFCYAFKKNRWKLRRGLSLALAHNKHLPFTLRGHSF